MFFLSILELVYVKYLLKSLPKKTGVIFSIDECISQSPPEN